MRHLQFICYESCPLDAWPEDPACCHDVPDAPHLHDDAVRVEAEANKLLQLMLGVDARNYEAASQGGMWKYSSRCQKKPGGPSSEISVLCPEDLSPWPPSVDI